MRQEIKWKVLEMYCLGNVLVISVLVVEDLNKNKKTLGLELN